MAQKITVDVRHDGKLTADFEGFVGDTCLHEAEQLRHLLARYGVNSEVIRVDRKREEIEMRRLETQQKVGT